ncbi:MAG: hypothetical protein ACXAB7_23865, partial [Candidatus Kariarchaeaceae archaeon]
IQLDTGVSIPALQIQETSPVTQITPVTSPIQELYEVSRVRETRVRPLEQKKEVLGIEQLDQLSRSKDLEALQNLDEMQDLPLLSEIKKLQEFD